jgi:hypothetical protein
METPKLNTKQADEIFCWSCGNAIKKEAVFCIHCGVVAHGKGRVVGSTGKSKGVAIAFAVFFSYWSWIYTWKQDWPKFVIGFTVNILGAFLLATIFYNLHRIGLGLDPDFCYPAGYGITTVAVWVYAIVDRAVRPTEKYENYPNI